MTRLSDSLRGLADRAPIEGVEVSTVSATRRIRRGRRLRVAANTTAGVGVAAVIALAAAYPGVTSGAPGGLAAMAESDAAGGKLSSGALDTTASSQVAWGVCGSRPFDEDLFVYSDAFTLTLDDIAGEVASGATIDVPVTVTRSAAVTDSSFSSAPAYLVLWDGIVVGTGQAASALDTQVVLDGTGSYEGQLDLVNCWDGAALPAGSYELVAFQDYYPATAVEPAAPTEPSTPPLVEPGVAEPGVVEPGVAEGGIAAPAEQSPAERSVSNRVALVIAGDVPADPFGQYLGQETPVIAYPDDYLDPDTARAEFAARATSGTWDMAAGSQRVVMTGDSRTAEDPNAWMDAYYGCSMDGITTQSFPATSADWRLLDVAASVPNSVRVSYGWVINDNPVVNLSVTNASDYKLPGFWGQPNPTLYLVKNGTVVAMSYLSSTDPMGATSTYAGDGMLAPGASVAGTFLWRDVNGCWSGDSSTAVAPGTYTILSEQDVYVDNGMVAYGYPQTMAEDSLVRGDSAGSASAGGAVTGQPDMAIAPAMVDGTYNDVTLQVWTSLGEVTLR